MSSIETEASSELAAFHNRTLTLGGGAALLFAVGLGFARESLVAIVLLATYGLFALLLVRRSGKITDRVKAGMTIFTLLSAAVLLVCILVLISYLST